MDDTIRIAAFLSPAKSEVRASRWLNGRFGLPGQIWNRTLLSVFD